jgi:hypothetical protein
MPATRFRSLLPEPFCFGRTPGSAALGPGERLTLESRNGPNVRCSRWLASLIRSLLFLSETTRNYEGGGTPAAVAASGSIWRSAWAAALPTV